MDLRAWRLQREMTLAEMASALGIAGNNPGRTAQRIETGERFADADLAEKIIKLTRREVGIADLHKTRLAYLRGLRAAA